MAKVAIDPTNAELNALLDRLSGGETELVLERDGKPVAKLVSTADAWAELNWELAETRAFNRGIPAEELEAEIAAAIRAARLSEEGGTARTEMFERIERLRAASSDVPDKQLGSDIEEAIREGRAARTPSG